MRVRNAQAAFERETIERRTHARLLGFGGERFSRNAPAVAGAQFDAGAIMRGRLALHLDNRFEIEIELVGGKSSRLARGRRGEA